MDISNCIKCANLHFFWKSHYKNLEFNIPSHAEKLQWSFSIAQQRTLPANDLC